MADHHTAVADSPESDRFSAPQPNHPAPSDTNRENAAGSLLADLERRQDDVLLQLDELDRRLTEILKGLGVTLIDDQAANVADDRVNPAEQAKEVSLGSGFAKLPDERPVAANRDEESGTDRQTRAA